jgi:uncharacterized protein YukE
MTEQGLTFIGVYEEYLEVAQKIRNINEALERIEHELSTIKDMVRK